MTKQQLRNWSWCLLLISTVVGCAPLKLPKTLKLPGQSDKPQRPSQMTAMWTDTVLVEAGVVGYGGRLMFYGSDKETPVKVEGELTVFAYDDTEGGPDESQPARKYVFTSADLEKHYSLSSLGHSYSFWVPWGPVGGPRRQISLIARFKSKNGGVIMSEMTRHMLPGTAPPALADKPAKQLGRHALESVSAVQQASHNEAADSSSPRGAMTTSTINLPPRSVRVNLGERNAGGWTNTSTEVLEPRIVVEPNQAGSQPARLGTPAAGQGMPPLGSGAAATQPQDAKTPEAAALNSGDVQALVQELRAARESLQSAQESGSVSDRFERRRFRARIAPKVPPTRDLARSQPAPVESLSGLPPTPRSVMTNGPAPIVANVPRSTN